MGGASVGSQYLSTFILIPFAATARLDGRIIQKINELFPGKKVERPFVSNKFRVCEPTQNKNRIRTDALEKGVQARGYTLTSESCAAYRPDIYCKISAFSLRFSIAVYYKYIVFESVDNS